MNEWAQALIVVGVLVTAYAAGSVAGSLKDIAYRLTEAFPTKAEREFEESLEEQRSNL